MTTERLRGSSDRSILVLTSLAGGPKHGYALIKDVESFAGIRLGPGTLYGTLAKLEESGLIEALPGQNRRRPYRITSKGAEILSERLSSARALADFGLKRLAHQVP